MKLSRVLLFAFAVQIAELRINAETDPAAGDTAADANAEQAELVKKTLNPVSSLVSVPIQNNWDFGIGPASGRAASYQVS